MNILICAHEYYPQGSGIANVVYNLKKGFTKKGNNVKICSPTGPDYKIGSQKLIEKFAGLGIIYFWYKVSQLLKKLTNKYDIIYLHNPFLFKKINVDNITCVTHTLYYFVYKEFCYKNRLLLPYYILMITLEFLSYKIFLKNFNFIVTSNKTIEELKVYNIKVDKVIPNGVDVKRINLRVDKNKNPVINSKKYKFLFVGRLEHQKNLFSLLSTYHEIKKKDDRFTLTIIGEGVLKNKLIKFCEKNKITDCHFLGKIPHMELLKTYNQFDFFILSSYYEGFPLTLSESLGAGLIPVLSPISIFKDMQKKVNSGLIVDFNEPKISAIEFLNYFSSLNIKQEKLKIISIIHKYYTWERICQEYLK